MSHETQGHHQTDADGRHGDGDSASLTLVESLMAERRKFEHWLTALEARRSTTPDRVFTRVGASDNLGRGQVDLGLGIGGDVDTQAEGAFLALPGRLDAAVE